MPGGTNGGGGGAFSPPWTNTPDIGSNLWLLITKVQSNQAVVVSISNTIARSNYLLLASKSLTGPWVTNQSLVAPEGTNVTVGYPIGIRDATNVFFIGVQADAPFLGSLKWVTNLVNPTNGGGDNNGAGLDASPAVSPWDRFI